MALRYLQYEQVLLILRVYPADDVREASYRSAELVMSFFHHLGLRAIKSLVTTEEIENSLFMSLRSVSKFTRNFEIYHGLGLENDKFRLKNIFQFVKEFP